MVALPPPAPIFGITGDQRSDTINATSQAFVEWGPMWLTRRVPAHVIILLAREARSFSSSAQRKKVAGEFTSTVIKSPCYVPGFVQLHLEKGISFQTSG